MPTDPDLDDATAARSGDARAFATLVGRRGGAVRAVLRGSLGPTADVDDLAQEVFLRAWSALDGWRPRRGSFRTWLLAIARNLARDRLRRRARHPRTLPLGDGPAASAPSDPGLLEALDGALATLDPERRVAFLLADVHHLPLAEIATIERVPLGTVKSRLDRARKALRAALESAGEEKR